MNPTVARGGRSFKGAFQYYMHDKEAKTRERVAWTHAVNILTDDPEKAWKVMAYTAKHQQRLKEAAGLGAGGRKLEKPVMAYSLSWHPDQKPSADHMRETALASLKALGLEQHEAMMVAHSDTPHMHVHIVVNRVHPLTGKVASDSYTYRKLSDFALEYDLAHGLDTSPQRAENKKKREKGERSAYRDAKIAEAWAASDNGKSLIAALAARGYVLAQGDKRLVVIDPYGKIRNPVRHIEGIKTMDFMDRLKDVRVDGLPEAKSVASDRAAKHEAGKATLKEKTADTQISKVKPREAEQEVKIEPDFEAMPKAEKVEPAIERQQGEKTEATEISQPAHEPQSAEGRASDTGSGDKPNAIDLHSIREDLAAVRLNRIQDRQIKERADVFDNHHRRILSERDELMAFYRLAERRAEIEALREKCKNPPWWRRWFGYAAQDRAMLETLSLNLADAQGRFDERMQTLGVARMRSMEALKIAQQGEWEVALRLNRASGQERLALRDMDRTPARQANQKRTYDHER